MIKMMRKDGKIVPNAIQNAPQNFRNLYPIKMAILTAKIPGTVCAKAIKSRKSSFVINLRLYTTSPSISGIMEYPPPIVNRPSRVKKRNELIYKSIFVAFINNR